MSFKGLPIVVLICCVGVDAGLYLAHANGHSVLNPFIVGMGLVLQLVGIFSLAMASQSRAALERHGLTRSKLLTYGLFALTGGLLSYAHGIYHGGDLYVPWLK